MRNKLKKYNPNSGNLHAKGTILQPVKSVSNDNLYIIMTEHKKLIYSYLIVGVLIGVIMSYILFSMAIENNYNIFSLAFVIIFIILSLYLIFSNINKIRNDKKRTLLQIDKNEILYYDSVVSETTRVKWKDVMDIVIKYYNSSYGYNSWILIQTLDEKIISLNISSLYIKNEKMISLKRFLSPEYIELRNVIMNNMINKQSASR